MKDPFFSFYQIILCVRSLHITEHFFNKKLKNGKAKWSIRSNQLHLIELEEKNNKLLFVLEEKKTAI